jgi:hypothetical protein
MVEDMGFPFSMTGSPWTVAEIALQKFAANASRNFFSELIRGKIHR